MKIVAEMTEIGETVERVDALIKDTKRFQKMCDVDIERAEEVIAIGTQWIALIQCNVFHVFISNSDKYFTIHL